MKFFQAAAMSLIRYSCTTCTLINCIEKNLMGRRQGWCFEDILKEAAYKTVAVWPLTSILQTIHDKQDLLGTAREVRMNS